MGNRGKRVALYDDTIDEDYSIVNVTICRLCICTKEWLKDVTGPVSKEEFLEAMSSEDQLSHVIF